MEFKTNIISDQENALDLDLDIDGVDAEDDYGRRVHFSWAEFKQIQRRVADYEAQTGLVNL